ncbi:MAG: class I SAM-dependent methyltransferase [Chloroflexia bacterium]|nr:class I SAM-dependent methyltransferase [Chloroflexia bacterium]
MTNPLEHDVFWKIHRDLPREAPGSDAATMQALAMLPDLPPNARILDVGCGPGAQTLALAKATQGHITAVDTYQPFLDELACRAAIAGVGEQITPVQASMLELPFEEPFDLIWSEGAIYIMGFAEGLTAWRRHLKPGGSIVVSDLSWLQPDPPADGPSRLAGRSSAPATELQAHRKRLVVLAAARRRNLRWRLRSCRSQPDCRTACRPATRSHRATGAETSRQRLPAFDETEKGRSS